MMILDKNWKFHHEDFEKDSVSSYWDKGYDDSLWEDVTVPHDWSVAYPFSKECSSGTGYVRGGIGWYRLRVRVPQEAKGKKLWIHFDGVYKRAQVWCNSYYLGEWANGYTSFRFDISELASFDDDEMVIAVKVRHTDVADSRWFTGSGIYRKVTLEIADRLYIEPDSCFFQTKTTADNKAEIALDMTLINESEKQEAKVTCDLYDGEHKVVSMVENLVIEEQGKAKISFENSIDTPKLWTAQTPNLYKLVIAIDGQIVRTLPVGIRTFEFDADKGFYVNGDQVTLKGVCLHHDAGCLGAAVYGEVWERRLQKLKAMGCNAVRGSHNPHMKELYELCDVMGFYFIDEIFDEWEGPKNKWSTGHNVYPPKHQGYFEDYPTWHEKDIQSFVRRAKNHPSIIMWSIGNEIDYPNDPYCHPMFEVMTGNNDNNKPVQERQYNKNKPNAERLIPVAKQLKRLVLQEDESRPVTMALAYPELSREIGLIDIIDVVGYNYMEEHYESDHQRFPNKPFFGSENNHEYEAWRHVTDKEYIFGQFLWTGVDYLGEAHGWPIRGSSAGHLTTAGYEKSHYYFRQSLWSDKPMVKIFTYDEPRGDYESLLPVWNYVAGDKVTVVAYTNQPEGKLLINGKELEQLPIDETCGYIKWEVPYEAGKIEVLGINAKGETVATDTIETTGQGSKINLTPWSCQYSSDPYLTQLEVTISDELGKILYNQHSRLIVDVEGDVELVGIENGDLADVQSYKSNYRNAYEGRMILYVHKGSGEGKITIRGNGLKSATMHL